MSLDFIKTERKIQEQDINIVEDRCNITFPAELKEHYLKYNGGCPTKKLFVVDNNVYNINFFFSIGIEDANSFEKMYMLLADIIPKDLIPFADDIGGNIFAISVNRERYGRIYYYDHEESEETNLIFLADSFQFFMDNLTETEIKDTVSNINLNSGFTYNDDWFKQFS